MDNAKECLKGEAKRKAFEALKNGFTLQATAHLGKRYSNTHSLISLNKENLKCPIPLYQTRVSAGLPSHAEDTIEKHLNLHDYLIPNQEASFCVRVEGDSMLGAGIHANDFLVIDTQKEAKAGDIIVASVYGELTVKRLKMFNKKILLVPANPKFSLLEITEAMDFRILGVVLHVIHSF